MHYPSLNKLRTFVEVATSGSFRKASARLNLSPQALSAHVRDLEDQFRLPLFHRTTRSVRLTAEGERFLIRARRVLDELEHGLLELQDHADLRRGLVVVTCMPTLASRLLPGIVASFIRRFPGVETKIYDEIAAPLIDRVRNGEADFGIGPQIADDKDLAYEPLIRDSIIAAFAKGHPFAKCTEISLHDLVTHRLLVLTPNTNIRTVLERAFVREGLVLNPAHEALHRFTLCGMAEAGLGIALLPEMTMSAVDSKLLVRPIVRPSIAYEYGIISRRDHAQSPAVTAFLTYLRKSASIGRPAGGG